MFSIKGFAKGVRIPDSGCATEEVLQLPICGYFQNNTLQLFINQTVYCDKACWQKTGPYGLVRPP